jgi:hypothetical protein
MTPPPPSPLPKEKQNNKNKNKNKTDGRAITSFFHLVDINEGCIEIIETS